MEKESSPLNNEYLQSLFRASELSPASVIITDLSGIIEYANPRFCEVTGYSLEEVIGKNPRILKSGEMETGEYQNLWKTITTGGKWRGRFHNRKKNGELYWEQAVITGISTPGQGITHYLAVKEFITDVKEAELELKLNKARLTAIFNNTEVGIGLFNRDSLYTLVNQRWADMLGMTTDDLLKLSVSDVSYPLDMALTIDHVTRLFNGEINRFKYEKRYVKSDGSVFWGEVLATPIVESDGNIHEAIAFINDITERKDMEEKLFESELLYRSIITASPDNITITDLDGNMRYASPISLKMFGYEDQEGYWEGRNIIDFILPEDRLRAREANGRILNDENFGIAEYRGIYRDGTAFPIEVNGEVLRNANGVPEGFVFVVRDITERRRLEDDQRLRLRELEALQATMKDISSELELPKLLDAIARRLIDLLHDGGCDVALYDEQKSSLEVVASYNHNPELVGREIILGQGLLGQAAQSQNTLHVKDDPDWDPSHASGVIAVPLMNGLDLLGVVAVGVDRTVRRFNHSDVHMIEMFAQQASIAIQNAKLFAEVHRLAITDALTGVYNRGYFFEQAHQEFVRCTRYPHALSLIMLDVDHFKEINDRFGHRAGDRALRDVAALCLANTRDADLVGRYGGEEFVILLPETPLGGAAITAERLREQIRLNKVTTDLGEFHITVSIGAAELKAETRDLDELIEQVDQAMYQAKRSGRNRVVC
jgi:diguanylate cyclase (GGDEF)-like protein/PAS domain S-box-containing protein